MRCGLILVHLAVVVFSRHHSSPVAAAAAANDATTMSRWCADTSLEDLLETSDACEAAGARGGGSGADECWASVDAVLQLCLDEAVAAGYLPDDRLDVLPKRNRNRFLGKKDGGNSRNNFLGKRETDGRLRGFSERVEFNVPSAEIGSMR